MQWIAPSEKDTATETLEKRLRAAADPFRANSGLKAREYSAPVLGLIFLRFATRRAMLNRLSAILAPSFRLIQKLHLNPQNLRWTRDLLLPRLLSGQVNLTTISETQPERATA